MNLSPEEQAAAGILLGNLGTWNATRPVSKAINGLLEKLVLAIEEAS